MRSGNLQDKIQEIEIPNLSGIIASLHRQDRQVENLIFRGEPFINNENDGTDYVGLPRALEAAMDAQEAGGMIATLPYLIAGKAHADKRSNYLWKDHFTALSEQHVIIDTKGTFTQPGKPLVIILHGPGIFTPERIQQADVYGLMTKGAAALQDKEAKGLIKGQLPGNRTIQLYTIDEIKKGLVPEPFGNYGIVLDFDLAKSKPSGYLTKADFMKDELVMARAGTLEYLEKYYKKAKGCRSSSPNRVGNRHRFTEIDPTIQQGVVLYLSNTRGLNEMKGFKMWGCFVCVNPPLKNA